MIPVEKWELMKKPIKIMGLDGSKTIIKHKAKNIPIYINNVRFVIPKIICFPKMQGDILLGNNFICRYLPFTIWLSVKEDFVEIPLEENNKIVCNKKIYTY